MIECSATIYLDGDEGESSPGAGGIEVKCQLPPDHQGRHRHEGTTEFGKDWQLEWEVVP